MKLHPRPQIPGDSETARFDAAVRRIFTVSKNSFLEAEAKKRQANLEKQELKTDVSTTIPTADPSG
jgi:hypothetical protein